jgi:hypothetical protein
MHNLTIERCWADPVIDLYELCITCSNDQITASAMECWTSDEDIDELADKIEQYSKKKTSEFEWKIGNFELNELSEVNFKVLPTDKFGYLYIQIDMKIYDSSSLNCQSGNCTINIKTEIGLLEAFGKRISKLKERKDNVIVSLLN